ncbi:hypothetical protein J6590_003146 [Homalodisca vitripennis]|nr:hypothetical protein J6590_003146 [Homalodisca vitripennis]
MFTSLSAGYLEIEMRYIRVEIFYAAFAQLVTDLRSGPIGLLAKERQKFVNEVPKMFTPTPSSADCKARTRDLPLSRTGPGRCAAPLYRPQSSSFSRASRYTPGPRSRACSRLTLSSQTPQ